MTIQCVESIVYGVDDLALGVRYFEDWGLEQVERGKNGAVFRTLENTTVVLRSAGDRSLPASPGAGSQVREIVWGVDRAASLDEIASELSKDREIKAGDDGTVHSADDEGFAIAFRVSRRKQVKTARPGFNSFNGAERKNRRIRPDGRTRPVHMGHVAYAIPEKREEAARFYLERLGFKLSDRIVGAAIFMRCAASTDHHNLVIMDRGSRHGFLHVAFGVGDFDEVMMGGSYMESRKWRNHGGPGRHIVGSNVFWSIVNPSGGHTEYYTDMDHLTEDWEPRDWPNEPGGYAFWVTRPEQFERLAPERDPPDFAKESKE